MTLKRDMRHPNFIAGLISYVLLLVGIVLLASNQDLGRQLILTSVILGGLHWVISIINVSTDANLKDPKSRYFWLSIIIMIPPMGWYVILYD